MYELLLSWMVLMEQEHYTCIMYVLIHQVPTTGLQNVASQHLCRLGGQQVRQRGSFLGFGQVAQAEGTVGLKRPPYDTMGVHSLNFCC